MSCKQAGDCEIVRLLGDPVHLPGWHWARSPQFGAHSCDVLNMQQVYLLIKLLNLCVGPADTRSSVQVPPRLPTNCPTKPPAACNPAKQRTCCAHCTSSSTTSECPTLNRSLQTHSHKTNSAHRRQRQPDGTPGHSSRPAAAVAATVSSSYKIRLPAACRPAQTCWGSCHAATAMRGDSTAAK